MIQDIEKLAIANRGEVAVRIIRACQELGIETVLLHSEADRKSLAYRLCDEAVCIGEASLNESYLNIDQNIQGAKSVGADAIHPGFGFLSENPAFAQACKDNRLIFVGPSPESLRLFGDKISAKKLVEKIGIPTIPGYQGEDQKESTLLEKAKEIGFPVMVKAAAGGGGRGLRVAHNESTFLEVVESARREAMSAFGSDDVFLEKYFDRAKHIEVQIFGANSGKVFHLMERECSVQRRHQKVIEEALSPSLDWKMREAITNAAVKIGEAAKYLGAGTVEFLVQDGDFYFLEMNTRLQVEHPITELVMGVDLVKSQILTAQNIGILWSQEDLKPHGHSIECRIYAEDPYQNGMPSTGMISGCYWPSAPGRRFEIGFEAGDEITPFYDSMIAKIIVWDETRPRAIQKMRYCLKETVIFGLKTNIDFLLEILSHNDFVDGTYTTQFIEKYFPSGLEKKPLLEKEIALAEQVSKMLLDTNLASEAYSKVDDPWKHTWGNR